MYFTPTTAGPQHLVWLLLCKLSQDGLSARLSGLCEKPLTSFFFGVRDTDTLNVCWRSPLPDEIGDVVVCDIMTENLQW